MRRYVFRILGVIAVSSLVACGAIGVPGSRAASRRPATPGVWGRAIPIRGASSIHSVSCTSPGNCVAGGGGFVVSQVRGKWRKPEVIPGFARLGKASTANVGVVSCGTRGNCVAAGSYRDRAGRAQAFVADEVRGRWHNAREVPGTAALNVRGAEVDSVSCTSPGNCTAAGSYQRTYRLGQAFVVSEVRGRWHKAIEVPGLSKLNTTGTASITVFCAARGNCSAAGTYSAGAFVVSQVNGVWRTAIQAPGTAALGGAGGAAELSAVSCGSPGNCAVVGDYSDSAGFNYPFVENQVRGVWKAATPVPGMTALDPHGAGHLDTVSCAWPGDCTAGGAYGVDNGYDFDGGGQPFTVTETNGKWGKAREVPGIAKLNTGLDGWVTTISCPTAGSCVAGGFYGVGKPDEKIYDLQAFIVSEFHGRWSGARNIPGLLKLNRGQSASVDTVSCSVPGRCSVSGGYADAKSRAFVVSEHRPGG